MAVGPAERSEDPFGLKPWGRGASTGLAASILVLVLLIAGTLLAWRASRARAHQDLGQQFDAETLEIHKAFKDRMEEYEIVLVGAQGLFAQGFKIDRKGWRTYVDGLRLDTTRPGIQGIGFARRLRPGEGPQVEQAIRAEGLTWFRNWPPQAQPGSSIILLEPMDGRNRRAFGLDLLSEPIRRAALEQARDAGRAALTGKLTLVQEDGKDSQFGFLLCVPSYPGGRFRPRWRPAGNGSRAGCTAPSGWGISVGRSSAPHGPG